ncbi:MAG: hypothetical protein H6Q35_1306 [Proteobacteria bacterium]|nr:hypothetical protein [Pseudomonadota bacterium]
MNLEKTKLKMEILNVKLRHSEKMCSLSSFGWLFENIQNQKNKGYLEEAYESFKGSLPSEVPIDKYVSGLMLILLVREVEQYFIDILKLIIQRFPKKIGSLEVSINDVVDLTKEEIIFFAAEKYLNEIMYKRPSEYFVEICKLCSIEPSKITTLWNHFAEAKVRRDIGIHNNWIVNDVYMRKTKEIKKKLMFKIGESAMPDTKYILDTYKYCNQLIDEFTKLSIETFCGDQ